MVKKSISHKNKNKKIKRTTSYAPLCVIGQILEEKQLFEPIHQLVKIPQKTVIYRPTDKLLMLTFSILAGAETVYGVNHTLRVDKALFNALGYKRCADQSTIQDTLNAATEENVSQLQQAVNSIWNSNNLTAALLQLQLQDENEKKPAKIRITIDIDLSGQKASKKAQGSKKGYFSKDRGAYGRQLARVLVSDTNEIVAEELYPGNTLGFQTFKAMVKKMETRLNLQTKEQREAVHLRLDAGFGTDANLNSALSKGYSILAKMYYAKRAKKLAPSVKEWVSVPSESGKTPREAGWVTKPHRYCKKTKQVCIKNPKKNGRYSYCILVSDDLDATLQSIVTDYDKRGGVPESNFCQDYQGLKINKRRKKLFMPQKMLMLLNALAHNLVVWIRKWLVDALEPEPEPTKAKAIEAIPKCKFDPNTSVEIEMVQNTLLCRGMKRFVNEVFSISGRLFLSRKTQRIFQIRLNPLQPLINRIVTAFAAFLKPFGITVSLDEI